MWPYILLVISIFFISILYQNIRNSRLLKKILGNLIFWSLVFFAGVRHFSVGTDTGNYIGIFSNRINNLDQPSNIKFSMGIGYELLQSFASFISHNYFSILTLIALIVMYFYYKVIINLSENIIISFFAFLTLGIYLFFFNGARQGIAAAIYAYAIIYIIKNDFKRYLFWVLIASSFHITALITIPVYFLAKLKFNLKNLVLILILSLILFLISIKILEFFPENISKRYIQYIDRGATGGHLLTLYYVIITFFLILFRTKIPKTKLKLYDIYLNLIVIHTFIYLFVFIFDLDVNLLRLSLFFSIGFILIFPIIYNSLSKFNRLFFLLIFMVIQFFFLYIYLYKMANLIPYSINPNILSL